MGSNLIRWVLVSSFIYLAVVLYAELLGLIILVLFPAIAKGRLLLSPGDSALLEMLKSAFEWGTLAGMIMGPCLGFTVVRDFNESIERPGDERRWWSKTHTMTLKILMIIAITGFALSGLAVGVTWIQGKPRDVLMERALFFLLGGHFLGAFAMTMGYFLRSLSVIRRGDSDPPSGLDSGF